MKSTNRTLSLLAVLPLLMGAVPVLDAKGPGTRGDEVRQMRDEVLNEFYAQDPGLKSRVRDAAGYAVFSNVGVNVLFASFAAGHGVVVKRGLFKDEERFMRMGSAGIGPGLGVKDFRALFIFTKKERLEEFIAKGWDFGGRVDAAAKSGTKGDAVGDSGSFTRGVEVYQLTRSGVVLQATLQGAKYWKDDRLN